MVKAHAKPVDKQNNSKRLNQNAINMLKMKIGSILISLISVLGLTAGQLFAQTGRLVNEPLDISGDFRNFTNTYYLTDSLHSFDPATASGKIIYSRYEYFTRQAFNNMLAVLRPVNANEFPTNEYAASPVLPFEVRFVSPKTIRIRMNSKDSPASNNESLMLVNGKAPEDNTSWKYQPISGGYQYRSQFGTLNIYRNPWRVEILDKEGKLLTRSNTHADNKDATYTPIMPFSFVRRASDYSRSFSAVFTLEPGEKIFGCGESFTQLNKRGQKIVLWADDANGVQSREIYKPIPFYMSSRGYGIFMHTSGPITCDFGSYFHGVNSMMIGDDELDLFVFLGEPKDILDEYTNLTGKASMPPLWSFGLWMSRITYFSEEDGRNVAADLRKHKVPADVIHFDTGWFETDWRCDYKFSPSRFSNPQGMIDDLKKDGFRICLWQLPYFVPQNTLYQEIIEKGLAVKNSKGQNPYEDAVLDFSNPNTVDWYQEKIGNLLKMGVAAIKVDFGEAAPLEGIYASGKTGYYEHNLYPLRYNKAVADITQKIHNENIIWARSAWAGSQRYPLHWGGDAANTSSAMSATLRAGLSFGLSGFSFWGHDIGGFVLQTPEEIYRRWLPFGMLTSHSRCHGAPPKEPWLYNNDFLKAFRAADEMKYKLMPYIYAQSKACTEKGLPMTRALFIEYPNDPGSWLVEDEYLFGADILVGPLMEDNTTSRDIYLPPGIWIDYQTGESYSGGWHHIQAGPVPVVMLVRDGAVIPQIELAQSTEQMDWSKIRLQIFASKAGKATGLICLPSDNQLHPLELTKSNNQFSLEKDPLNGRVKWTID